MSDSVVYYDSNEKPGVRIWVYDRYGSAYIADRVEKDLDLVFAQGKLAAVSGMPDGPAGRGLEGLVAFGSVAEPPTALTGREWLWAEADVPLALKQIGCFTLILQPVWHHLWHACLVL